MTKLHNRRPLIILALVLIILSIGAVIAQDAAPLYRLPSEENAYSSNSIALTRGGRLLIVTNMLNNTVSITAPLEGSVIAEVPVGKDPRSVAITFDDQRALVVNRGDGTLSVLDIAEQTVVETYPLGVLPYGVVTDNNETAFVSLQAEDEIVQIELATGEILERISVPSSPAGLALWGNFLYVTHLWSGDVSLIFLPEMRLVQTVSTGAQTALSPSIAIDTVNDLAYVPQSRSNTQSRDLTFDNTITPVVNVLDLHSLKVLRDKRITLDSADRPVNMPFAAMVDPLRHWLYVVNAGSNDVSVIDPDTGMAEAHIEVDANPRGVIVNRDRTFVYVHSAIDGLVTVIDARYLTVSDEIVVSTLQIPVDVLIGAQLFHSADDQRLSTNNFISCAGCHFDGQSDGRMWPGIGGDGTVLNTPVLYGLMDSAPYSVTGEWDELSDVELHIRAVQTGTGLLENVANPLASDTNTGLSPDLDILVAYLSTLQVPENPTKVDQNLAMRGAMIFEAQGCSECHSESPDTDSQLYDVGTGGEMDTPTLRWLWMSAPYFHDGSARTLREVFIRPGTHRMILDLTEKEIDALVEYLLSIP